MSDIAEGMVFRVRYPFTLEDYKGFDADGPYTSKTWQPGVRMEWCCPDDTEAVADAEGEMILTVVSIHKPGRFPTRVFFTRRWRDPKGREFGKPACRSVILSKFRRLTRGFQHEFIVRPKTPEPATAPVPEPAESGDDLPF